MVGAWLQLLAALAVTDTGLVVRAVRFYRADPGQSPGQTQVTAFLRVPADLPTPGRGGEVSLGLSVRVVDSGGGVLYQQAWQRRTSVPFPRGEADRLDLIRFTLRAGRFRLEASVTDSVSGRRADLSLPVEGYGVPPAASDLMISSWLRPVASLDTLPQPGEFRRGGLIVAIAPEVTVGGPTASVAYLLETYAGTVTEGRLTLAVTDSTGFERRRVGPAPMRAVAGIGLVTGQMELGDLPAGRYRLRASIDLGGAAVVREASFVVDPVAASAPSALSDQAYFDGLPGPQLDLAFAPLSTIAEPRELDSWQGRVADEEKRAFLVAFWRPRDPSPRTAGNERRAQFYDGVTYVNAFYTDARRRLVGWQTDRGRIFLRQGLPPQVLRREQRGGTPGYEIWRYFEQTRRYYVFVDRGALGGFGLVRSNDPGEPREPRWQDLMTPAGVREVVGFLGRTVLATDK